MQCSKALVLTLFYDKGAQKILSAAIVDTAEWIVELVIGRC